MLISAPKADAESRTRVIQEASYEADMGTIEVKMTRKLIDLGNGRFRLEAQAKNFFGSIREYEDFLWIPDIGIQPSYYRYEHSILGSKRKKTIKFDWKKNVAHSNHKGKKSDVELKEGVLGPMTYQLQLQLDLLKHSKQEAGIINNPYVYEFISRGKLKKFQFRVVGIEDIRYEKHKISKALKMVRANEGGKRQTTIWFDPTRHYSIASIVQTKEEKKQSLFILSNKFYPPFESSPLSVISET